MGIAVFAAASLKDALDEVNAAYKQAKAAGDFLIGFLDFAEIAPEAVLVQLLVGRGVPRRRSAGVPRLH